MGAQLPAIFPYRVHGAGKIPLMILALTAAPLAGQDAHYWTDQFGARSDLLGGLVVGDVADPSAAFYNPGALGIVEEPAFLLSANGFQHVWITLDGQGVEPDLKARRVAVSPDFVAGNLPLDWLGKSRISYSAFSRLRQRVDLDGGAVDPHSVVADAGSTGQVRGASLDHEVSETWVGVTWGYPVGPRVGVGVTSFLAVRNQSTSTLRVDEAFTSDPSLKGSITAGHFGYSAWRVLWKAGIQARVGKWSLGASVTTPGIHLFGSGRASGNATAFEDGPDPSSQEPFLAATDQKNLAARYRTSWAAAGGATYRLGRGAIHTTLEWFGATDPYAVIETRPFESQTGGDTIAYELGAALQSVVNGGIGFEWAFSPRVTGYSSVRTDFSAATADLADVHVSVWDLYHLTAGTELAFSLFELTLGLGVSFGSAEIEESVLSGPPAPALPGGTVDYLRLRALFGLQYFFGRDGDAPTDPG